MSTFIKYNPFYSTSPTERRFNPLCTFVIARTSITSPTFYHLLKKPSMEDIFQLGFFRKSCDDATFKAQDAHFLANSLPFTVHVFSLGSQDIYIILVTILLMTHFLFTTD